MRLLDLLDEIEVLQKKFLSGKARSAVGLKLIKHGINEKKQNENVHISTANQLDEIITSVSLLDSDALTQAGAQYKQALEALELRFCLQSAAEIAQTAENTFALQLAERAFNPATENLWSAYALACREHSDVIHRSVQDIAVTFLAHAFTQYEKNKEVAAACIRRIPLGFLESLLNTNVDDVTDLQKSLDMENELKKAGFKMFCLLQDYIERRRAEGESMFTNALAFFGVRTDCTKESKMQAAEAVQQALVDGGLYAAKVKATEVMTQGRSTMLRDTIVRLYDRYGPKEELQEAQDSAFGPSVQLGC